MRRTLFAALLALFASFAQAGMLFSAAAVPADQVEQVVANERLLLSAFRGKDGSLLDLGKAWHGLHFLLTGTAYDTSSTLGQAILGGQPMGEDLGYGPVRVLSPQQVKAISAALSKVTQQDLSARYNAVAMDSKDIYPQVWVRDGAEGLRWLLSELAPLQAFYKRAAEKGQAVLLLIS